GQVAGTSINFTPGPSLPAPHSNLASAVAGNFLYAVGGSQLGQPTADVYLADLNANPTCSGVTCTALDACHDVGTCDPTSGVCSNPPKPDFTPCNDNNNCTTGDV